MFCLLKPRESTFFLLLATLNVARKSWAVFLLLPVQETFMLAFSHLAHLQTISFSELLYSFLFSAVTQYLQ